MIDFLSMFNIEYLTQSTWLSLSTKMVEKSENEIEFSDHIYHQKVVKPKWKEIFYANNNLKGIFSYLKEFRRYLERSSCDLRNCIKR